MTLSKSIRYANNIGKPINLEKLNDMVYEDDSNNDIFLNTYADLSELSTYWDVANLIVGMNPNSQAV